MKKSVVAAILIIVILAAVAVGVTAYASDGYTLPVEEWGERLGIEADKETPDEDEKPDDTPGTNTPGTDEPDDAPGTEIPGEDETPDENEAPLFWKEISTDFYALSETGDDATEPITSTGMEFPVAKMKQIFEDLKDFQNNYILSAMTIQFESDTTPGHYEKNAQVLNVIYQYSDGLIEDLYGPNQDMLGEEHVLQITYVDPDDGTIGYMFCQWINPNDPESQEIFYCEIPEGYGWFKIYGSYLAK